jgi:hypothetical protein
MWYLNDVYENVAAYYQPKMSIGERRLLDRVRKHAILLEGACLPRHYAFLMQWSGGASVV